MSQRPARVRFKISMSLELGTVATPPVTHLKLTRH